MTIAITDQEFAQFQRFIFERAGITIADSKRALVTGRLSKRLVQRGLNSFGDYHRLLLSGHEAQEVQTAVDLLTTNETYFFREAKHFDLLRDVARDAARDGGAPLRVWSAASSSGEEAYSAAMVLAEVLGEAPWEVVGTDISSRIVARARQGHYPMERARHIPPHLLRRYCLRGLGEQDGTLLVERNLRQRVRFVHANLIAPLPALGQFDVVFLRNVLIYFNRDTKREVVRRVIGLLKPGGLFFIGHSESLNDISAPLDAVCPSVYRRRDERAARLGRRQSDELLQELP
ncbi:MAG: protein-glutamate O-methyltransferase CheR [Burkholderiaceae bacterium]|nr:protein-glutamate O-methyltransferase CheR [Burkholderiaceae bacterium]